MGVGLVDGWMGWVLVWSMTARGACWIQAGYTALHLAAMGGHKDVVELLLQGGANPNCLSNVSTASLLLLLQGGA